MTDHYTNIKIKKRTDEDGKPSCEGCAFSVEGEWCSSLDDHCPHEGVLEDCPVHHPKPNQKPL